MWDRFLNSFELARTSLAVLRKDKELVAFPIISGLLCLYTTQGAAPAGFNASLVESAFEPKS